MSDSPDSNISEQMLACEVPDGAQPGSTFHVISPDHKYYEVVVPEHALPGDTINILLSQTEFETAGANDESQSKSVSAILVEKLKVVGAALLQRAVKINHDYKITERVHEIDNKYEISSRTKAFVIPLVERAKQIDEEHKISDRVIEASSRIIVFAREIDERFAISATAGRFVNISRSAIQAAVEHAKTLNQEITQKTSAVVTKTTSAYGVAVSKVQELSAPIATAEKRQELQENLSKLAVDTTKQAIDETKKVTMQAVDATLAYAKNVCSPASSKPPAATTEGTEESDATGVSVPVSGEAKESVASELKL